jgi:hypothetical protein
MNRQIHWLSLLACVAFISSSPSTIQADTSRYDEVVFPNDTSVIDVVRDFGAKGDGKTDDTAALQAAIEASSAGTEKRPGHSHIVYIPNGTYRVTNTLVVKSALGPWLYGQSRDRVIIRLDDHVSEDVHSVMRTHPNEQGPTSADWFMRNLRNFTIDAGDNPHIDGIRYYATNSGCLQNVRVIGNGKIGINGGFLDQSGPNLIQDVEIDGFDKGILSQWIWSQTMSRIKISNCRTSGIEVSANVVAIEDLHVIDTPIGVDILIPNGWGHWSGVVAVVGGKFECKEGGIAAIRNDGILYARDLRSNGYEALIAGNTPGGPKAMLMSTCRTKRNHCFHLKVQKLLRVSQLTR